MTDPTPEQLARDVLSLAQRGGMTADHWLIDTRIARACTVLGITPDQAWTTDWCPGPTPEPAPLPTDGLEVWTDGACSGNPGPGGWGWVTNEALPRSGSGNEPDTTNQRMEILAAVEALTTVAERPVTVVSDSRYVVDCFHQSWWRGWQRRGWTNSKGAPVANRELWEALIALVDDQVSFRWVKAHAGHELNEMADQLAVQARERISAR